MRLIRHVLDIAQGKVSLLKPRSSKWPKVREQHLRSNPVCAVCKGTKKLNVHHIQPFHLHPELELDPANLITLCESKANGVNCHLWFGHLGNFKQENPQVKLDAPMWQSKVEKAKA
jgi:5-methylcytosine-specific restriction protein A